MNIPNYLKETHFAVTICDNQGIILYMNQKAQKTFEKWGGVELIGKSLFECHNQNSVSIIKELLSTGKSNSYTIEKNGEKKLIHQTPYYENNVIAGLVELSIVLPEEMPHHKRS